MNRFSCKLPQVSLNFANLPPICPPPNCFKIKKPEKGLLRDPQWWVLQKHQTAFAKRSCFFMPLQKLLKVCDTWGIDGITA